MATTLQNQYDSYRERQTDVRAERQRKRQRQSETETRRERETEKNRQREGKRQKPTNVLSTTQGYLRKKRNRQTETDRESERVWFGYSSDYPFNTNKTKNTTSTCSALVPPAQGRWTEQPLGIFRWGGRWPPREILQGGQIAMCTFSPLMDNSARDSSR